MTIPRRTFGSTPVSLSVLCYGTMRLVPERFDDAAILDLILNALDAGITSFHVSHEYASYSSISRAMKRAWAARPGSALEIIAKFAVPHFDETQLDPRRMRTLVERTLMDFEAERVDVVQWLVRQTPNSDELRLSVLERASAAFFELWDALKREGKAAALGVFPYSDAFLRRSLEMPGVDGIISYHNRAEQDLLPYLDELSHAGRGAIGVRPLSAGAVREPRAVESALRYALDHPALASTIVGLSSSEQIAHAVAAVAKGSQ